MRASNIYCVLFLLGDENLTGNYLILYFNILSVFKKHYTNGCFYKHEFYLKQFS